MVSLAGLLTIDKTTIVESGGMVRLGNATIRILADAFMESGLGTYSDALLCIIPALWKQLPSPDQEHMLSALIKTADEHRRKSEWDRAETLMRWACQSFAIPQGTEEGSRQRFVRALRMIGELYRWSLAPAYSNSMSRDFGIKGVKWMARTYDNVGKSNAKVKEILDYYSEMAEKITRRPVGRDSTKDTGTANESDKIQRLFIQAIQGRKQTEAVYNLCFITISALGSTDLQPALPLVVRNNWNEVVSALLETKADPNSRDDNKDTAISHCAELGYDFCLETLVDYGASLDLSGRFWRTPLHYAAICGHENISKFLLNDGAVDPDRLNSSHETPLLCAARYNHGTIVKQLLAKGVNLEHMDGYQETPLVWAIKNGNENIVQQLLERGANTEVYAYPPYNRVLVEAVSKGHETIVQWLLERGADPNFPGRHTTPLICAAENGHLNIGQWMLDKGADVRLEDPCDGKTALWKAVRYGHETIVQLLLEYGADVNSEDKLGGTPLTLAIKSSNEAIIQLLECYDNPFLYLFA